MTYSSPERDLLLAEDDIDDVLIFELALKKLDMPYALRHADNGDVLSIDILILILDDLLESSDAALDDAVPRIAEVFQLLGKPRGNSI